MPMSPPNNAVTAAATAPIAGYSATNESVSTSSPSRASAIRIQMTAATGLAALVARVIRGRVLADLEATAERRDGAHRRHCVRRDDHQLHRLPIRDARQVLDVLVAEEVG